MLFRKHCYKIIYICVHPSHVIACPCNPQAQQWGSGRGGARSSRSLIPESIHNRKKAASPRDCTSASLGCFSISAMQSIMARLHATSPCIFSASTADSRSSVYMYTHYVNVGKLIYISKMLLLFTWMCLQQNTHVHVHICTHDEHLIKYPWIKTCIWMRMYANICR